jgi:hypothetical protein
MARFTARIRSPKKPSEVFDYLADLRNFAQWDPGVTRARQLEGSGGGPDAVFEVSVKALVGTLELRYETVSYIAPESVRVVAKSAKFTSDDTISVTADPAGCVVTYDAQLHFNGRLGSLDFAHRPLFNRIARKAGEGLVRTLDGERLG